MPGLLGYASAALQGVIAALAIQPRIGRAATAYAVRVWPTALRPFEPPPSHSECTSGARRGKVAGKGALCAPMRAECSSGAVVVR